MRFHTLVQAVLLSKWEVSTNFEASTAPAVPAFDLTLRPCLTPSCDSAYVDVHGILETSSPLGANPILSQMLSLGNIELPGYDSNTIEAWDGIGPITLTHNDTADGFWRNFYPDRPIEQKLHYSFRARPQDVTRETPAGPRQVLRYETHGFNGAIMGLGPLPPIDGENLINAGISFDLMDCPDDASGAWSLGHESTSRYEVSVTELYQAFFVVGMAYQAPDDGSPSTGGLKTYYFSDPPFNVTEFAIASAGIFAKLSEFFRDPASDFMILLRKNINGAVGGSGGTRSFLIEYGNESPRRPVDEWLDVFTHEFIHIWALLIDSRKPETLEINERYLGWYVEGTARYYQFLLPYRFGLISKQQVLHELNALATSYYTSSAVGLSDSQLLERMWYDSDALEMIYNRGAMHFLDMAGRIEQASEGQRGVDEIILALVERRRNRSEYTEKQYLDLLGNVLGHDNAYQTFEDLENGTLIVPPHDALKGSNLPDFGIRRIDQEEYELGFDRNSLDSRFITGMIPGSRADLAGVKNGDQILDYHFFSESKENANQTIRLGFCEEQNTQGRGELNMIQSQGRLLDEHKECKQVLIEYLPRAIGRKVESWKFFEQE